MYSKRGLNRNRRLKPSTFGNADFSKNCLLSIWTKISPSFRVPLASIVPMRTQLLLTFILAFVFKLCDYPRTMLAKIYAKIGSLCKSNFLINAILKIGENSLLGPKNKSISFGSTSFVSSFELSCFYFASCFNFSIYF